MKHTPGPWSLDSFQMAVICQTPSPTHDYAGREDNEVCVLDDGEYINYKNEETRKANANLIAAAPELLQTCKEVLMVIHDDFIDKQEVAEKLKKIIKKAEG